MPNLKFDSWYIMKLLNKGGIIKKANLKKQTAGQMKLTYTYRITKLLLLNKQKSQ